MELGVLNLAMEARSVRQHSPSHLRNIYSVQGTVRNVQKCKRQDKKMAQ